MKTVSLSQNNLQLPAVVVGCMRIADLGKDGLSRLIHTALEGGTNYFDHADIYGDGECERLFGETLQADSSLKREDLFLQSKCAIRKGVCYDQSKEYILSSVDGILQRLQSDYLDVLLLHRPDALVEPEEVAEAFEILHQSGKVRYFGVSNHKPMQIELLKKYVRQPLLFNQLQFSIPVSNMVANGMEVNMETDGAPDRDGSVLDYSRLTGMTVQAWSPFQKPKWRGTFMGDGEYAPLNKVMQKLAGQYGCSETAIAAAWILRHPANMQLITGTTRPERLREIISACDISLTREQWYELYLAAGHPLP